MASTTLYCSRTDITNRFSSAGILYVADDDLTGNASESELVAALDEAIDAAGAEIDEALDPWIESLPLVQDDAARNEWLKQKSVDLAVEYLCGRRGGPIPASVAQRAERARKALDMILNGARRVPGLTYPLDAHRTEIQQFGRPVVGNPPRRRCR